MSKSERDGQVSNESMVRVKEQPRVNDRAVAAECREEWRRGGRGRAEGREEDKEGRRKNPPNTLVVF